MSTTRRHFLQGTSAAAGLAWIPAAGGQTPANEDVHIALIGAGGQGNGDLRASLAVGGVKLVAASDVYQGRLTRIQEVYGKDVFVTRDYREVLSRKDIDAVIVATPDHWHTRIAIDAMNAGKDVYLEKPMIQKPDQGMPVVEAQTATGRILQIGSQRVSSIVFKKAKDLLQSGAIGELSMVEAWWDRNSAIGAWQYSIPPDATPENIDWDRFLGSAPERPFEPIRLFRWRNYQDYGTGVAGDLFVHLFSGLHFITGALGPTRIMAAGGLCYWRDGRDVPDVMLGLYEYPKTASLPAFTLALRVNFKCGTEENYGVHFVGSEGVMSVADSVTVARMPPEREPGYTIETFAKATQTAFLKQYRQKYPYQPPSADTMQARNTEEFLAPEGYSDHREHHRNFIEAVRSRKPVVEDAAFGFRAAAPAVLSNLCYFGKKQVTWDPDKMVMGG